MTQEEIEREDKVRHETTFINKKEVMTVIKSQFDSAKKTLETRSQSDQNLLGNFFTVLELELKKQLKTLKTIKNEQ